MTQATSPYLNRPCRTIAVCKLTLEKKAVAYYDCGICGAMHRTDWHGDCREDAARFYEVPE